MNYLLPTKLSLYIRVKIQTLDKTVAIFQYYYTMIINEIVSYGFFYLEEK